MTTANSKRSWPLITTLAVLGVLVFWSVWTVIQMQSLSDVEGDGGGAPPHTTAAVLAAGGRLHPVHVQRPAGPPRVVIGRDETTGELQTASCTTCHATREPDLAHGHAQPVTAFHGEIQFRHGTLSCLSCHDSENYDSLRGADGRAIAYSDVMQLCAQCHGRQFESYQNGAHGGMNGYWDLSQGPRRRNNCTDCHDPHSPAFPSMKPTFKPIDRGLGPAHSGDHK